MKKSNFIKVGISVGSVLFSAQGVFAESVGPTNVGSQPPTAGVLSNAWNATPNTTIPTRQTIMHMQTHVAPPPPPPVKVPPGKAGTVTLQTNIMCGDQDVNNFHGGVNPIAPSTSKSVQFLSPAGNNGNPQLSLVFGYWAALQSDVPKAGTKLVPGEGANWLPLGYNTISVAAATKTPQPTVDKMDWINKTKKTGGGQDFGNLIETKVGRAVADLGQGSYVMPGATAASSKYAVYFGLMACNNFDTQAGSDGTGSGTDYPDSLEIADFQAALPSNGGVLNTVSPTVSSYVVSYNANAGVVLLGSAIPSASWKQNVDLTQNQLYLLGKSLATEAAPQPIELTQLTSIQTALDSQPTCAKVPVVSAGETSRWYEAFPMQTTCAVLNPTHGSFAAALTTATTSGYGAVGTLLMKAGLVQQTQVMLDKNAPKATARCFHPNEEYIDQILASVVFPFTVSGGALVALAPGGMTHPEALFANSNYGADYCTPGTNAACKGSDFNTLFGMTIKPSLTMLAKNSSGITDGLSELLVPSAEAAARYMLDGGPADPKTAGSTYKLGTGMIDGGVVVPTAVYTGSLQGTPDVQAAANAQWFVPVTAGSSTANPTVSPNFLSAAKNGLGIILNVRAIGSGSGCPVKYCKADGQPTASYIE